MTLDFLEDLESFQQTDKLPENIQTNFEAYISDAKHFLSEEDYIRAFESAVYASGLKDPYTRLDE